jgi:hypothetical protein
VPIAFSICTGLAWNEVSQILSIGPKLLVISRKTNVVSRIYRMKLSIDIKNILGVTQISSLNGAGADVF